MVVPRMKKRELGREVHNRREVGVNVGSLVLESYRNGQTHPPPNPTFEKCEGRGFSKLSDKLF